MCGAKKPKTPKPQPNYQLMRESEATREAQQVQRASLKKQRLEAMFGLNSRKFGRAAILPSGAGGAGYGGVPRAMQVPSRPNGA